MQKVDTLIRTKLRPPLTRPGLVSRPRLRQQVAQGLFCPLTLIAAPAGFGKTTLAADGVAGCGMPVAWLSLDKNDNQLDRFLVYLVAAFQAARPPVQPPALPAVEPAAQTAAQTILGKQAAQLLSMSHPPSPETILTSLINDLYAAGQEMVLVLDDFQFITRPQVHEELTFLLEHCPTTLHLVIVTRSDPPLPLARLRARCQMVELRASDLRFTASEAAEFLNDVMGLHLDAASISALEERTEGWIAGLQMAALSMRDRKDVPGFIQGFSGTNRYILDYLLEEVLAGQPPNIQYFLLCTSILDRLSAPLCESVLEVKKLDGRVQDIMSAISPPAGGLDLQPTPGSPATSGGPATPASQANLDCQSILEYLERSNLFLVPLDDERRWYRYHHLFADLLRARLDQAYPELAPELHTCAAAWFQRSGFVLEAIQHASMALNDELVERLIEQHYLEMMNRGEMSAIRFWMGKLSKEWVLRRPWLCLYEAFRCSWFGQLDEASLLLTAAANHIRADTLTGELSPGARAMQGYHDFVHSRVTAMQGDTPRAIELCQAARQNTPAGRVGLQIEMGITLGYEYFLVGDFVNACQTFSETIALCYAVEAVNNPVAAYALLARAEVVQGRTHPAHDLYQKAARLVQESGGQYLGVSGLIEVGMASLLCEWNDLPAALDHLTQGLDFLAWWGKADDSCLAYLTLSRIQRALGDREAAALAVEKAVELVQTRGVFSEARRAAEAAQVQMWLDHGDRPSLEHWSAGLELRLGSPDLLRFEDEPVHITLARVLLVLGKPGEAIRWLSRLEDSARTGGRLGRLVEILILKALALHALGKAAPAEIALSESLALAGPGGFVRTFLDEGHPLQQLLTGWLVRAGAGPSREYAAHLLSLFDPTHQTVPAFSGAVFSDAVFSGAVLPDAVFSEKAGAGGLVEPLSQREREVLQLIALGCTNQEIARQLVISPGTVKAHTASIYRKLDVSNRTEAVAHARQLGILS